MEEWLIDTNWWGSWCYGMVFVVLRINHFASFFFVLYLNSCGSSIFLTTKNYYVMRFCIYFSSHLFTYSITHGLTFWKKKLVMISEYICCRSITNLLVSKFYACTQLHVQYVWWYSLISFPFDHLGFLNWNVFDKYYHIFEYILVGSTMNTKCLSCHHSFITWISVIYNMISITTFLTWNIFCCHLNNFLLNIFFNILIGCAKINTVTR